MEKIIDMVLDDEVRIAEATAAVDRVFEETGFEPVEIPDFDPDVSVYTGKMMDDATRCEKQEYIIHKMHSVKQWIEDGKEEADTRKRIERSERSRAREFARSREYEQREREKLAKKKEFIANCDVECLKLRHRFHESEQASGPVIAEYYMDELIKNRHEQAKCRIDIEKCGHEIYGVRDRLIVCDLLDVDHDNNGMPTKAVDYCGYVLYGMYDENLSDKETDVVAKFTMFTVTLAHNITAVCLSLSDRVYVPGLLIKGFDGTIGLHEELDVYLRFQKALINREPWININLVSGWISKVMHTIVSHQPGFDPDKFVCVKHRLGMVLHDDQSKKLNKCAEMECDDCPFSNYCNIFKLKNEIIIKACCHVYEKKSL